MLGFADYSKLINTNGAVSLMQTGSPRLPTFAALLANGEVLDTFTDRAEAEEFCEDARDRMRDGLQWPDPDAPAVSDIRADVIGAYAMATVYGKGIGETMDAMTAAVNAWNACTDKTVFLNQ